MSKKCPTVLIILDGFGYRTENEYNAINQAQTPMWDKLWNNNPHTTISASGTDVGLPHKQMGNSEVGHMNLGAGRIIDQDLTRISKAFNQHKLKKHKLLQKTFNYLSENNKALHLLGLSSPGGVHSHEDHIADMIELAHNCGVSKIYLHAFLDGRDTPPRSAHDSLELFENLFAKLGCGHIASVTGRYYAMDRDKRWDRIQACYDMLTLGKTDLRADSALQALEAAYQRDENDEFVQPTIIRHQSQEVYIADDDVVLFMNFRADRARQLSQAFTVQDFDGFTRQTIPNLNRFITLTEYASDLQTDVLFPKASYPNVLAEVLANAGKTQLHVAETEKYAHVTFFFNGGREEPYPGEDRILIPSPKVATYDLHPQMSAPEVTEVLARAITGGEFDFIVCNYANADMIGHTGNFEATVAAIECLDHCLANVVDAIKKVNGQLLITADHGNAELMFNKKTGQAHTAHTNLEIPLVYLGQEATIVKQDGILADVAPTLLHLMQLPIPPEMTGRSILELK